MPVLRWSCATARYSPFNVPVETGTPPARRKVRLIRNALWAFLLSLSFSSISNCGLRSPLEIREIGDLASRPVWPSRERRITLLS